MKALLLTLMGCLFATQVLAQTTGDVDAAGDVRFEVEISRGSDADTRTREVRKYFQSLGREFEVYRVRPTEPTAAGKRYQLERERAGNFRHHSLKVAKKTFYRYLASEVRRNFVPLEDSVHGDDSDVTGEELLQILYRHAKALRARQADLDTVKNGVTLTYVYDDFETILMPTVFNYADNAVNAEGSTLESDFGINSFSKHYLLALILNKEAEVTMAGKIFIGIRPLHEDSPISMEHVFLNDGDVDLSRYRFHVTVTNDSGTFKPDGEEIPAFADVLAQVLDMEVHYQAWTPPGTPRIEGTVEPRQ